MNADVARKDAMISRSPLTRTALCAVAAVSILMAFPSAGPTPSRVVAIGDVHGAFDEFTAILRNVSLIDAGRNWTGGAATLVQTGDVVDRGAKVRECLDLLMSLQRQAPRDGGAVIALLGNHEVMNLIGDLRYVTPEIFREFATPDSERRRGDAWKEYLAFLRSHAGHGHEIVPPADGEAPKPWMDEHPPGFFEHRDAFGPQGGYGKWIRSNPALADVAGGLFVHGGVNPGLAFKDLRELDARVAADIAGFDAAWKALIDARVIWRYMTFAEAVRFASEEFAWRQTEGPVGVFEARPSVLLLLGYKSWLTLSADSPLWYRGLATEPESKLEASLTAMLQKLKVNYIVSGHSVVASKVVTARFDSRVFLIDTGMLGEVYAGRGSALEIQDGRFVAHRVDAMPQPIPAPAGVKPPDPIR